MLLFCSDLFLFIFFLSESETQVEISDSLRGKDVFIIQTGSLESEGGSINDSIMELLIVCYACKTSSARSVTGEGKAWQSGF